MEKKRHEFIYEWTDYNRKKAVLTVIISSLILIAISVAIINSWSVVKSSTPFTAIKSFVIEDIEEVTPLGLFYITFLGDLFFNPLPPELFFVTGLIKGNPIYLTLVLVMAGAILAHIFNYFLGSRFHGFFRYFMSKKNLYKLRRKVNKYGAYAVLIFNVAPFPAPLLTFALGITKYNVSRLFTFLLIGNFIKYGAITLFYTLFV